MRDSPYWISVITSIVLAIGCIVSACELAAMESPTQPATTQQGGAR